MPAAALQGLTQSSLEPTPKSWPNRPEVYHLLISDGLQIAARAATLPREAASNLPDGRPDVTHCEPPTATKAAMIGSASDPTSVGAEP
jgi:hypothetical protein